MTLYECRYGQPLQVANALDSMEFHSKDAQVVFLTAALANCMTQLAATQQALADLVVKVCKHEASHE